MLRSMACLAFRHGIPRFFNLALRPSPKSQIMTSGGWTIIRRLLLALSLAALVGGAWTAHEVPSVHAQIACIEEGTEVAATGLAHDRPAHQQLHEDHSHACSLVEAAHDFTAFLERDFHLPLVPATVGRVPESRYRPPVSTTL